MKLVSYHQDATKGDYLVCQPPGTDATVKVAVGPELQSGLQSQRMPDGAEWVYSDYNAKLQTRTASCAALGVSRTEYITPPLLQGESVPVGTCSNTGVSVGGVAVTLIALTAGRRWFCPENPALKYRASGPAPYKPGAQLKNEAGLAGKKSALAPNAGATKKYH